MIDRRLIINEIQRQFPKDNDNSIESLLRISPTLRGLIESEEGAETFTTTFGTFSLPQFLTPSIINQIVREIAEARNVDGTSINSVNAINCIFV